MVGDVGREGRVGHPAGARSAWVRVVWSLPRAGVGWPWFVGAASAAIGWSSARADSTIAAEAAPTDALLAFAVAVVGLAGGRLSGRLLVDALRATVGKPVGGAGHLLT